MEFVFTGFKQVDSVRQYGFQGIAEDRSRQGYVVATDVSLLRKYRIPLQDLPLLFRRFLQAHDEANEQHSMMFSEEDMRRYAENRAAEAEAAASKRTKHRHVPTPKNSGMVWRGARA